MSSSYSPIWKRVLYKTPLYKKGPCGNYHLFTNNLCFCRVNEHGGDWHGGIYCFEDGKEYVYNPEGD